MHIDQGHGISLTLARWWIYIYIERERERDVIAVRLSVSLLYILRERERERWYICLPTLKIIHFINFSLVMKEYIIYVCVCVCVK